jgi:fumarate reductase subunit D
MSLRGRNSLWWAAMLHRLSGLALALFLPAHFWALGSVLSGGEALQGVLNWSAHPLVKFAEFGLVFLLSVHLAGGLRVMALEALTWRDGQKLYASVAVGVSLFMGLLFLMRAV